MATFTWTAQGQSGGILDPSEASNYQDLINKIETGTITSESIEKDGKFSIYVDGGYDFNYEIKNLTINENLGVLRSNQIEMTIDKFGSRIVKHNQYGDFIIDTYKDDPLNGYIQRSQTIDYETSITVDMEGAWDYSMMTGSVYQTSKYQTSGDDTFNGSSKDDRLYSGGGNDVIYGNDGNDILHGDQGIDIIFGGKGDDVVKGGSGNDSLNGNEGNDSIDGGTGFDIANYPGNYSDYSFVKTGSTLKVVDNRPGKNSWTDTLTSIELIDFADQKQVDPNKLNTTSSISSNISSSKTYTEPFSEYKFYTRGNGKYEIETPTGFDDITGMSNLKFTNGTSSTDDDKTLNIFKDIKGTFDQITGKEDHTGQMFRLYNAAFARFPDADGLAYWIDMFGSGANTKRQVANSFLGSSEFAERYGANVSDSLYVDTLYTNVLGRLPDAEGKAYWLGRLSSGAETRAEALLGFAESDENKILFSDMTGVF